MVFGLRVQFFELCGAWFCLGDGCGGLDPGRPRAFPVAEFGDLVVSRARWRDRSVVVAGYTAPWPQDPATPLW